MTKERRLGRGLEALLGSPLAAAPVQPVLAAVPGAPADTRAVGLVQVPVYDIEANPFQPRREFDEADIDALSDSICEHGLLQPIVVRCVDERYQLVAGERRLRAAIKAGWTEVPSQVVDVDDRHAAEISIVENLQRKDLNPLEKAASFKRYLEVYQCTQDELAKRLQLDRSTIANLVRLLELPDEVQQAVRSGKVSQGHARALLPLGDEREQVELCRRIADEGLSVRAIEAEVQEIIRAAEAEPLSVVSPDDQPPPRRRTRPQHLASLEQELRAALGTKVDVREGAKGRGRIVIHFSSHEEFDRLHAYLCGSEPAKSAVG